MRNFFLLFLFSSIFLNSLFGQKKTAIIIGYGYNKTNLNWSISGDIQGNNPNILSELIFKNIVSKGVDLGVSYSFIKNIEINFNLKSHNTTSGMGKDTDYEEDDRISPTYSLRFESHKGYLKSFTNNILYTVIDKKQIKTKVGMNYEKEKQEYHLSSYDYFDLKNTYTINPWSFGGILQSEVFLSRHFKFSTSFFINKLEFNSTANWRANNFFREKNSFQQFAKGKKYGVDFTVSNKTSKWLRIFFNYSISKENYNAGIDQLFLRNGNVLYSKFNGGIRKSHSFLVGFRLNEIFSFLPIGKNRIPFEMKDMFL